MLTFVLCIAVLDLGIGFYLGMHWIMPAANVACQSRDKGVPHITAGKDVVIEHQHKPLANTPPEPVEAVENSSQPTTGSAAKAGWKAAANNAHTDISSISERIRYASAANDKQLAKDIAAELRTRSKHWQSQIQQRLAELAAELERDPTAKLDCVTPELCLAQIESLQTNLELLDWAEPSEVILEKLQREVTAVKKLLPEVPEGS